jgi:hypothetical protein
MSRKALKISAIVIGVLLLLPVLGVFWAYTHQDKIIRKALDAVDSSINGTLDIGGFEFKPFTGQPGLTFSFTDIVMKDSLFHTHGTPLCNLKGLDVTFGLETLFTLRIAIKQIAIRDGSLFIFVRRDSYSNLSLFKDTDRDETSASGGFNPLKKIKKLRFHNLKVTYADSLQEKFYDAYLERVTGTYQSNENGWLATIQGPVKVEKLIFNAAKGAFLKERPIHLSGSVQFKKKDQNLVILPETYLQLETHERINVSGNIQMGGKGKPLNLDFQTSSIRVPVATSLLADSIAHKIDKIGIDTYVSADVSLRGTVGDKFPWVTVQFKTDTFSYHTAIGTFKNLRTNGTFNNRVDSLQRPGNSNAEIKSGKISGFFEQVPVRGSLQLTDLSDPTARIVLNANADSTGLNSLLDTERYHAASGRVSLDLFFNGKLKNLYDKSADTLRGKLVGKVIVDDLAVSYLPKNINLSRIECKIAVSENTLTVHKLDLFDNQNVLHIHGNLSRYLHLLLGSPHPAKARVDVNIPKWKLNWIEVLVGEENQRESGSTKKFSNLIDELLSQTEVEATLKAGELSYRKLKASKVVGSFTMNSKSTAINSLRLHAFGGEVAVKGTLTSPDNKAKTATLNASGSLQKANVKSILYSFNDFGQNALSSKNVDGQIDLNFQLATKIDPKVALVPQSMSGFLDVHLTDGKLVDFEPFLKIKKIVFKKRPLENVRIAPIKKRFELKGQEVRINKMQIETNVLTLFLEGQYSFGDKTDLSIQFPLKNLKKRDEDYEFQSYDSENLRSIFLRAVQEGDGVAIKLDSRTKAKNRRVPRDSSNTDPRKGVDNQN